MSLLLRRPHTLRCNCHRTFSTSTLRPISLQLEKNDPEAVANTVPPYPYGPAQWYKQSDKGLYGGQRIQFGNNVGPKSGVKTRRSWQVNVLHKRIWSKALDRFVQVRVTARTLRTIDKVGGLDEYLLGEKEGRIRELGLSGWWLRWAICQTPLVKKRFAEERSKLGLPEIEQEVQELEAQAAALAIADATATNIGSGESEAVTTDDAFVPESSPDLPPLKFRVGKGQHLVLTPTGWQRTRPSRTRVIKKEIREEHPKISLFMDEQQLAFKQEMKEAAAVSPQAVRKLKSTLRLERSKLIEAEFERRQRPSKRRASKVKTLRKARRRTREEKAATEDVQIEKVAT